MTDSKVSHYITKGRFETWTTELGSHAFSNRFSHVKREDIDWEEEETYALHGALYGGHLELARQLLDWGSPVSEETYEVSFHYLIEFIPYLPFRPEIITKLEAASRQFHFHWALVYEDSLRVMACLHLGVDINKKSMISGGIGDSFPIHYAVRKGNLELIKMVTEYGAKLNSLNQHGKSALRLLAENILLSNSQRRSTIKYLRSEGAEFTPELSGWREKLYVYLGWPIEKADEIDFN